MIPAVQHERTCPTRASPTSASKSEMYAGNDIDQRLDDGETAPRKRDGARAGVEHLVEGFAGQVEGRLGAGAENAVDSGLELAGGFGKAGVDARHGGLVGLEAALEEIGLPLGL